MNIKVSPKLVITFVDSTPYQSICVLMEARISNN